MSTEEIKPGRVDGKNSAYRSGSHRIPKHCAAQIKAVLRESGDQAAHKQKKVGQSTSDKRSSIIEGFFSDLFYLGYKIENIHNLKVKHLEAVFKFLEAEGQSPSTLQNKISVMRTFCGWIGKEGMVRESWKYVDSKASVRRSMVVKEDKSWEGNGVVLLDKLAEIAEKDKVVAIELELCLAFGLRVKEAVMLRPAVAHQGDFLLLREGTKGARSRIVPVTDDVQRDVLARAKLIADKKTGFLGGRGKTLEQKNRRFYTVMESFDINLRNVGVSAHGLRHEYMQREFKRLLGIDAPVKGGDLSTVDKDEFHIASQILMEQAGHTRVSIGASYYGSRRILKVSDVVAVVQVKEVKETAEDNHEH